MKKITIFLMAALMMATSCSEDFLKETNPNALASDNFWKSSGDVDKAFAGVFSHLNSNDFYNGNLTGTNAGVYRLDFLSDNGCIPANYNYINGGAVGRGVHGPTDALVTAFWTACYKMIQRSNDFLENVDRVTSVTVANRNTMKAEVRFLRALAYHHLAMCFRDAPLVTKTLTLAEANVPKNTYKELSDYVISELNDITKGTDLALNPVQGRVSRGAALALLTRFYLYNKNYTESAATAQKIIDLNIYNLNTAYPSLFKIAGETSKDVIFAVQYAGPGSTVGAAYNSYYPSSPQVHHVVLPNFADAYYCTDGLPITRSPLYSAANKLLNRDPRYDATLLGKSSMFKGAAVLATNLVPTGYRIRKWADESAANSTNAADNPQDFYVLRYAEVLLNRAEALLESGTYTEAQVRDLVNQVRTRATMPKVETVEGTNLTKQQLIDIVRQERRIETAFEGLRYYDLKRWGILKERAVDVYLSVDKAQAPAIDGRAFEPRHYVWPIPQRELDINKALVQHDEWK
jgi:starch-binding outer membrane protein, SusD/RagB family